MTIFKKALSERRLLFKSIYKTMKLMDLFGVFASAVCQGDLRNGRDVKRRQKIAVARYTWASRATCPR
jgi:hypothetical protein